jgi:hypothetical protein
MQTLVAGGWTFHGILECAENENIRELHASIAFNKNGWQSYNNDKGMIGATRGQLLK